MGSWQQQVVAIMDRAIGQGLPADEASEVLWSVERGRGYAKRVEDELGRRLAEKKQAARRSR